MKHICFFNSKLSFRTKAEINHFINKRNGHISKSSQNQKIDRRGEKEWLTSGNAITMGTSDKHHFLKCVLKYEINSHKFRKCIQIRKTLTGL